MKTILLAAAMVFGLTGVGMAAGTGADTATSGNAKVGTTGPESGNASVGATGSSSSTTGKMSDEESTANGMKKNGMKPGEKGAGDAGSAGNATGTSSSP